MTTTFTIIIATYNAASLLPRTLDSLAAQICRDFSVIIQDGASSDDSVAVAQSFADNLPVLHLYSEKDTGIYDAWNKALDRWQAELGEWVLFLGAGDELHSQSVLQDAKDFLQDQGPKIRFVAGGIQLCGEGGEPEEIPANITNAVQRLRWEMPVQHTGLFHKATLFDATRFDTRYSVLGDYNFLCDTLSAAGQITSTPIIVTNMLLGGVSNTLHQQPRIYREACLIALRHFHCLRRQHLYDGCCVVVVAILCFLFGRQKAARIADKIRALKGKKPKWAAVHQAS